MAGSLNALRFSFWHQMRLKTKIIIITTNLAALATCEPIRAGNTTLRKSEIPNQSSRSTWLEDATWNFDQRRDMTALEIIKRNDPQSLNKNGLFLQARILARLGRYREAREINHRVGTIWAIFNNLCYASLARDTEAIDAEHIALVGLAVDANSADREKLFQSLRLDKDLSWTRADGLDRPALIIKDIQRAVEQKAFRINWLNRGKGYLCVPDSDPFGNRSRGSCLPNKSGECPDGFMLKKSISPASIEGCVEDWVEG